MLFCLRLKELHDLPKIKKYHDEHLYPGYGQEEVNTMGEVNDNSRDFTNSNEKTEIKSRLGNSTVYHYQDSQGRMVKVIRPAIVKIREID